MVSDNYQGNKKIVTPYGNRFAVQDIHVMLGQDKAQLIGKGQRGQIETVQTVINFDDV